MRIKLWMSSGALVLGALLLAQTATAEIQSSSMSTHDRFVNARVLDAQSKVVSNAMQRVRLVQTKEKYPIVRVEDTVLADGRVVQQKAMVADHVLVHRRAGIAADDLARTLSKKRMRIASTLADGLCIVQLPESGIEAVPNALHSLRSLGGVERVEPDYMVFVSESAPLSDLDRRVVIDESGVAWDCEYMLPLGEVAEVNQQFCTLGIDEMREMTGQRLAEWPAGARLITFDKPGFMGGPFEFNPSMEEQGFVFYLASSYMYLEGPPYSGSAFIPNNGTMQARFSTAQRPTLIYHRDNLPFTVYSVDLAEYSTGTQPNNSILCVGHKTNGATVSCTLYLDGVIDGSGPLADFETFAFPADFTDLASLELPESGYSLDNMIALVTGQESTPPAPPDPPVYYQVTFDPPIHTPGQLTSVGGPYAPSSYFLSGSSPTLAATIGPMTNAVRFDGKDQIRFTIRENALRYRVEFDIFIISNGYHHVQFDGNNVQRLDFNMGTVGLYQDSISGEPPSIANLPLNSLGHFAVDIDMTNGIWSIYQGTNLLYTGPFDVAHGDLTNIRFANSTYQTDPLLGLDNIVISREGHKDQASGPQLSLIPSDMEFPDAPIGLDVQAPARLVNAGNSILTVTNMIHSNSAFSVDVPLPVDILPGGYCDASITFDPNINGFASDTFAFGYADRSTNLTVSGLGYDPPVIFLSPTNLSISMLQDTVGAEVFTIGNAGTYRLDWQFMNVWESEDWTETNTQSAVPNDAYFGNQWSLQDTNSVPGGIDLPHALALQRLTNDVLVAVIDTGVDCSHVDIAGRIWTHPGEVPDNDIDDDGNGLVDDVHGYDFCNNDGDPNDGHGHGTHVAGIVAAVPGNALGIAGIAPCAKIIAVKFLSDSGSGFTSDAILALDYAASCGARILNNSWGGGAPSTFLLDAIRRTESNDCLFVASAGNDRQDLDQKSYFPCCYDVDNIVSVGSSDSAGTLSYFSNYGKYYVDLCAPGSEILSLSANSGYCIKSGTSMSAPHISGIAALMLSKHLYLPALHMRDILLRSVDMTPHLVGKVAASGKINAFAALRNTYPQWLQPQMTYGKVAPSNDVEIPLAVDTRGMDVRSYTKTLRILSNDPQHPEVALPVVLHVLTNRGLNAWTCDNFAESNMLFNAASATSWAWEADMDLDGMPNALEYFLGDSPSVAETGGWCRIRNGTGDTELTFTSLDAATDVSCRVEMCTNLEEHAWTTNGVVVEVDASVEAPAGSHGYRVYLSPETPLSCFLRLAVTPNE